MKQAHSISPNTRVLIVDDHELLRDGLIELLASQPGMIACGEAAGEEEAFRLVESESPDLALVDVKLEQGDGINLLKRIKTYRPTIKVIVISMYDEHLYGRRALRAGASGYVHKQSSARCVTDAINEVLSGRRYLSPELTQLINRFVESGTEGGASGIEGLADRELQVFSLLGQGLMTTEIAEQMNVSPRTVDTYRERLKSKLNLKSAGELNRQAMRWSLENE